MSNGNDGILISEIVKCEAEACVLRRSREARSLPCCCVSRALSTETAKTLNPSLGFKAQNIGKSPQNRFVFNDSQDLAQLSR